MNKRTLSNIVITSVFLVALLIGAALGFFVVNLTYTLCK